MIEQMYQQEEWNLKSDIAGIRHLCRVSDAKLLADNTSEDEE